MDAARSADTALNFLYFFDIAVGSIRFMTVIGATRRIFYHRIARM
jgi:hypothetical protein